MNIEDEKLKEMFRRGLEPLHADAPDFDLMWESAVAKSRKKSMQLTWKIAASIALLITVGVGIILTLNRHESQVSTTMQLNSWDEPTKSLMVNKTKSQLTDLTRWTSPTDFLLSENTRQIKN